MFYTRHQQKYLCVAMEIVPAAQHAVAMAASVVAASVVATSVSVRLASRNTGSYSVVVRAYLCVQIQTSVCRQLQEGHVLQHQQ